MRKSNSNSTNRLGFSDLEELMSRMTGDEKHSSSATSTLDVLWVLYDQILNFAPESPEAEARDRFLLSKGHGPMAYYAVLAAKGIIALDDLHGFGQYESRLGYHPDRNLLPGVEIASGSLGHGLPVAVGTALGLAAKGNVSSRVYVLIGDAELDEGSNHEAIAVAGRLGLNRLSCIVIDNQSTEHGWPGGIEARFEVEAWSSQVVDGRDHEAIASALGKHDASSPSVVVAQVEPKSHAS